MDMVTDMATGMATDMAMAITATMGKKDEEKENKLSVVIKKSLFDRSGYLFDHSFSSLMALATRFEFDVRQIPEEFFSVLLDYGVLMIFMTLIVFGVFRIYSSLWEYAGLEETFKIIGAVVFSSLCDMAIVVGMGKHLPRSYYVIRTFYLIALVGGSRFFYRLIRLRYRKRQHYSIKKKKDHADQPEKPEEH